MDSIKYSKNLLVNSRIDAEGNVWIGDKIIVNIYDTKHIDNLEEEQKKILINISRRNEQLIEAKEELREHPNSVFLNKHVKGVEVEIEELTKRSQEIDVELSSFKVKIIELAASFSKIGSSPGRLKNVIELFKSSKFDEAYKLLNVNLIEADWRNLVRIKEKYIKKSNDVELELSDVSNEFLVKAQLGSLVNEPFDIVESYYKKSIECKESVKNVNSYGKFLHINRQLNDAKKYYEKALSLYDGNDEIYVKFEILNSLGLVCKDLYQQDLSKGFFSNALDDISNLSVIDDNIRGWEGTICQNLGTLDLQSYNFDSAKIYYERSLNIRLKLYSTDKEKYTYDIGESFLNLSYYFIEDKRFERSIEYTAGAIDIFEDSSYDAELSFAYNNMAVCLIELQQTEKARGFWEKSLEIRERLCESKPEEFLLSTGIVTTNFASLFSSTNKYDVALEMTDKSLDKLKRSVQYDYIRAKQWIAATYANRSIILRSLGEYKRAIDELKNALSILTHLDLLTPQSFETDIAAVYKKKGDIEWIITEFDEAITSYNKAIDIWKQQRTNSEKEDLANVYNSLGGIYTIRQEYLLSQYFFEKAYEIRKWLSENVSKSFFNSLAETLKDLSAVYYRLEKFDKAIDFGEQGLSLNKELTAINPIVNSQNLAGSFDNLASVYMDAGDLDRALEYYQSALSIRRDLVKRSEKFLPHLGITLNNISGLFMRRKEYDNAISSALETLSLPRLMRQFWL